MELSSEDCLRLNVLLANAVAVRIDEGAMMVHGLGREGHEIKVRLNPVGNADRYIRAVRELLSSTVLGSPGGYPVYLKRWSRMGQASDMRLADLLMLGEPEAVVAISASPSLTDELARHVWWAMPDAENARRMLRCEAVAQGEMGRVLAEFLLEFLPFEQEPRHIIESVQLVLQPGLISDKAREEIWRRGRQKNVFMVGFLQASPDQLPEAGEVHVHLARYQEPLAALQASGNPFAGQLLRILSAPGQAFLQGCKTVLRRPSNQDVVVALLEALAHYFAPVRMSPLYYYDIPSLQAEVENILSGNPPVETVLVEELQELLAQMPELQQMVVAMLVLAHTGEPVVRRIFAQTDSIGSVMRKKLEPVSGPVMDSLARLHP